MMLTLLYVFITIPLIILSFFRNYAIFKMTGRDMAHPNHCYSPKSRGHKPTLSSVSNTFSDISCVTDISEVSNNSEEDITMTEDCDELNKDSISLKSMANNSPTEYCESDKDALKESLDNKTIDDSASTHVGVTKDCNTNSHVINTCKQTSVSCGPVSVIKLPVTGPSDPSGGGQIAPGTVILDTESDKSVRIGIPEIEAYQTMDEIPAGR